MYIWINGQLKQLLKFCLVLQGDSARQDFLHLAGQRNNHETSVCTFSYSPYSVNNEQTSPWPESFIQYNYGYLDICMLFEIKYITLNKRGFFKLCFCKITCRNNPSLYTYSDSFSLIKNTIYQILGFRFRERRIRLAKIWLIFQFFSLILVENGWKIGLNFGY